MHNYGLSCSAGGSSRPSLGPGGRVCFPQELCGANLSQPVYYGALARRDGAGIGTLLTAFVQENKSKGQYVMYAADEHMNVVQMLRPRDSIRMLPESGEVVLEATTRQAYVLNRPFFLDNSAAVSY